jgi:hypothetical protein
MSGHEVSTPPYRTPIRQHTALACSHWLFANLCELWFAACCQWCFLFGLTQCSVLHLSSTYFFFVFCEARPTGLKWFLLLQ